MGAKVTLFIEVLLLLIMTQPNLLALAKQGNSKAIATLINRQLQPKGITAKAGMKNGCLQIMLESAQVPIQKALVNFTRKAMMSLKGESIRKVKVYGRKTGEDFPAWHQEFDVVAQTLPNVIELAKQGDVNAIATLISQWLNSQSLTVKASLRNDCLQVILESTQVPEQQAVVLLIHDGLMDLGIESFKKVKIYGRETGEDFPDWIQEFALELNHKNLVVPKPSSLLPPSTRTLPPVSNGDDPNVDLASFISSDDSDFDVSELANELSASPPSAPPQVSTLLATPVDTTTASQPQAETWRCIRTLRGHSSWVQSVAFHPNGQTIASGSQRDGIKIWDSKAGNEIRTLKEPMDQSWVNSVAFSPDGQSLASDTGGFQAIKIWDWRTGNELRTLGALSLGHSNLAKTVAIFSTSVVGHSNAIQSLAFSSDGQTFASGSADTTIKIWDVKKGKEIRTLTGHSSGVESIAFDPDGKILASGSHDKTTKVLDWRTGEELCTLRGHGDSVKAVAFSRDGQTLATCSRDSTIGFRYDSR